MRLLPASLQNASSCEGWVEKPGYPKLDGCWIHAPQAGQTLPEFHFEEDEPRAESREPRAESREPRVESRESRAESPEIGCLRLAPG